MVDAGHGGHITSVTEIPELSVLTFWLKCNLLIELLKMTRTLQIMYFFVKAIFLTDF